MEPHGWLRLLHHICSKTFRNHLPTFCVFLQETSQVFRYTFGLSKQQSHCNPLGDPYHTGPLCHQERVSKSPSEHDHRNQHRFFAAAADSIDERVSRILPRSGPSRIGSETDYATQGFTRVLATRVLPREGPHDSRGSTREPLELVRRNLQRPKAREPVCPIRS